MCELIKKSSQSLNPWVDPGPLLVSNSWCLSHVSVCPEPSDLFILCSLFSLVCEFLVRAGDEWRTHRKALSALPPPELGTPSFSGGPPHSCFESSLSSEHATDLWTHPRWPVSTSRERPLPPQPLCTRQLYWYMVGSLCLPATPSKSLHPLILSLNKELVPLQSVQ